MSPLTSPLTTCHSVWNTLGTGGVSKADAQSCGGNEECLGRRRLQGDDGRDGR